MNDLPDRLLTSHEVEKTLGVGAGWCAQDRISLGRILHIKIGKSCRYRLADVQAFIDLSVRASTRQRGQVATEPLLIGSVDTA